MTLPGESRSWQRHAKKHLLHHCGHFRRVTVMAAGALDEGRIGGFDAGFVKCSSAKDGGHELTWAWPLHWSPAESSAIIAWQRVSAELEAAKQQLTSVPGKETPKTKFERFVPM